MLIKDDSTNIKAMTITIELSHFDFRRSSYKRYLLQFYLLMCNVFFTVGVALNIKTCITSAVIGPNVILTDSIWAVIAN